MLINIHYTVVQNDLIESDRMLEDARWVGSDLVVILGTAFHYRHHQTAPPSRMHALGHTYVVCASTPAPAPGPVWHHALDLDLKGFHTVARGGE